MKRVTIGLAAISLLLVTGCATSNMGEQYAIASNARMTQARVAEVVSMKGPVTIQVQEGGEYSISQPLQPLTPLPMPTSVLEKVVDGGIALGKFGLGVWAADSAIENLSKRPTTVSPEVVRPEIIFAPEGAAMEEF